VIDGAKNHSLVVMDLQWEKNFEKILRGLEIGDREESG